MLPKDKRTREAQHRRVTPYKPHPTKLHPDRANHPCRVTGKIKWLTELDAIMAICNTNNKQGSNTVRDSTTKRECRPYQCPDCDYWHTTHLKEYKPNDEPAESRSMDSDGPRRVFEALKRAAGRCSERTDEGRDSG